MQYHVFYDCSFKTDHFYSMLIEKNLSYFVYKLHIEIQELQTKNYIFMLGDFYVEYIYIHMFVVIIYSWIIVYIISVSI